ncbi:hypothetical protein YC2023_018579 [Brassica napus]
MSDHASPTARVIPSDHSVHADHNFPIVLIRPSSFSKTHDQKTELTELELVFPDLFTILRPTVKPESTSIEGILNQSVMNFEHPNFSKASILKLSDELATIWSRSVCENHPSDHMDRTGRVLLLTVGHTAGYNESG